MRNSVIRKLALNIAIFQLFLIPVASNAENKSTNYSLQPRIIENGNIINNENIGQHFVYVVEITDDKIIVSSYGRKYLFENKDPRGVDKIVLKLSK